MVFSKDQNLENLIQEAKKVYLDKYKVKPEICGLAPGRINLIGDHVDYNDGYVLPMTIPKYTVVVGGKNDKNISYVSTLLNLNDGKNCEEVDLKNITRSDNCKWINYVKGVINFFPLKDQLPNFNAVIISSVPVGSGLSSSASLEVSFFEFLVGILSKDGIDLKLSKEQKAKICQKAEHEFALVPCGIMDQLIAYLGNENNAVLIDCRNLSTEYIPIENLLKNNYCFLIIASNVQHELSDSEYPKRRKVCETVAKLLSKNSLREVNIKELEANLNNFPKDYYYKSRHVITEIERTISAAEALKKNDFEVLGALMVQSHLSLKNDYEVTCSETDEIVELGNEFGVFCRQSGGGFGGCLVSLIKKSDVDNFEKFLTEKYTGKTNLDFHLLTPGISAQNLKL